MVDYIDQTIRSVIDQGYPDLEYIVIDGGSTDGTVEIIEKYKKHIAYFVSEKDKGQYYAINKGLKVATGDVIAWLNADDIYFPWTFSTISDIFENFSSVQWLIGSFSFLDGNGNTPNFYKNNGAKPQDYISNGWFRKNLYGYLQQENMFWRRGLMEKSGLLNTDYRLAADFELWTRFAKHEHLVSIDLPLASFRLRNDSRSKLQEENYNNEVNSIVAQLSGPGFVRSWLGGHSLATNHFQRYFTKKKSMLCFYSLKNKSWKIKNIRRPISNISLSQYLTTFK
jgi:glycosyltransferase involved in cell wall biosynthesis